MIVALRRSAPHAAAPGLARGRALPHSFRRRCAAGLSQRDNPYQLRHALRFFKPPMDAPKPCACPAKMNQHLVYQRIDLDLFVKGVTTRGKFVERGDGHYYRVLAECVL